MKFDNIHKDIDFICVGEEAREDTSNIFIRRLKNETIDKDDIKSYWEDGKTPPHNDPKLTCSYKAVSCYLYDGNDKILEKKLLKDLSRRGSFKRTLSSFYCLLKLKRNAGKIWQDGTIAPCHCNFFKCDDFEMSLIEVIETRKLDHVQD